MVERIRRMQHADDSTHSHPGVLGARPPMTSAQVEDLLGMRERSLRPIQVEEVTFGEDSDGKLQIRVDDRPFGQEGLTRVCEYLDVPVGFIRRAPRDLADTVAARMLDDARVAERELVVDDGAHVVLGYHTRGTPFIPAARIAERVLGELSEADSIYLREWGMSIELDVVCRDLSIEPREGDVVRGGLTCLYSEVDLKQSRIRGYSERLVCLNGMVHRDFERSLRLSADASEEDVLEEAALAARDCGGHVTSVVGERMRQAAEMEVDGPQAIRQIARRGGLPAQLLDPVLAAHVVEDEGTAFGVLNAFTRAANGFTGRQRQRLQAAAGDELTAAAQAHCPRCYSRI